MSHKVAPTMCFRQRLDTAPRFYAERARVYDHLLPVTRPLVSAFPSHPKTVPVLRQFRAPYAEKGRRLQHSPDPNAPCARNPTRDGVLRKLGRPTRSAAESRSRAR